MNNLITFALVAAGAGFLLGYAPAESRRRRDAERRAKEAIAERIEKP
mgnify:CR=1 FL=1